ncbi:MAG: DUF5665 domain-containing protein [Candidatus Saccharimonadales bacterium]
MVKNPKIVEKVAHDQQLGARRGVLEEIFNDYYKSRRNIYKVNFVRGIFFGFGSVLGGTIVVALLVWALSFFVQIPGIGGAAQKAQNSLEKSTN